MTKTTANKTALQLTAQRVLLAMCMVFGVAVCGAATVQATNPEQPAVRFVNDLAVAAPVTAKAPKTEVSLLVSVASQTPAYQPTRTLMMEVTAYCACTKCCGPDAQGLTASGKPVSYNDGKFVAADTRVLPFGTKLQIPGYAGRQPVEVIDRGGAIKGNRLDVYFPTHQEALRWGRQHLTVTVFE